MKKIILSLVAISLLCGCASRKGPVYERYKCENGMILHAQFGEERLMWTTHTENQNNTMIALPKVAEGKYQSKQLVTAEKKKSVQDKLNDKNLSDQERKFWAQQAESMKVMEKKGPTLVQKKEDGTVIISDNISSQKCVTE